MRTTVDIPDAVYRELKNKAVKEGTTVKAVILRSIEAELHGQSKPKKAEMTASCINVLIAAR